MKAWPTAELGELELKPVVVVHQAVRIGVGREVVTDAGVSLTGGQLPDHRDWYPEPKKKRPCAVETVARP